MVDIRGFMEEMEIDNQMAREMYEIFAEELKEEKEQLLISWDRQDAEGFFGTLHNVKGISASYRASELHHYVEALYSRQDTGQGKGVVHGLAGCEDDMIQVVKSLKEALHSIEVFFGCCNAGTGSRDTI